MSTNTLPPGADHELDFWRRFITTPQFATWLAPGKTPELDDMVAGFIKDQLAANPQLHVLDVASGVVSILHGLIPNINLSATDVLGLEYTKMFDHNAHNVVQPWDYGAEELPEEWKEYFDIVHIRNGLDHCQDVQKAFDRMVAACKPGGFVIVQGFENEATAENWQGFHQWNMSLVYDVKGISVQRKDRSFVVLGYDMPEVLSRVDSLPNNKYWFIWIGQKPTSK